MLYNFEMILSLVGERSRRGQGGAGASVEFRRAGHPARGSGQPLRRARIGHAGGNQFRRGGPGPGLELRLRIGQGRLHRLPVRAAKPPRKAECACRDREAGLREHRDDRPSRPARKADSRTAGSWLRHRLCRRKIPQCHIRTVYLAAGDADHPRDPRGDFQENLDLSTRRNLLAPAAKRQFSAANVARLPYSACSYCFVNRPSVSLLP